MPKVTICGVPGVNVRGERTYGGGNIYPGARDIGRSAAISKDQAKRLSSKLGINRLPRVGYEMTLCSNTYLSNNGGRFEVTRRASGGFQGARSRRRRRSRR